MEFEYWWLLGLPAFFGLGWLAARVDLKHLLSESRAVPKSYFRGLNFLLNEQPDKAIEAFIEVVKVDPETVELHFALGSLFRRRGESDRAIRMHRNLLERTDLAEDQRLQALQELGQDYLKAGLLDRAEEVFSRLRNTPMEMDALRFLLDIFQQEKDWAKAIDAARELESVGVASHQKEISHFLCELASTEAARSRPDQAKLHLAEAIAVNRKCVRANVVLGDLYANSGDYGSAIDAWQRIEQQQPAYMALVAQRLVDAFGKIGDTERGLTLLRDYLERYPSLEMLDVVFQTTLEVSGAEAAYRLVKEELRRSPTLLGLDRLLEAQILSAPVERRGDLELIKNLVHGHTRRVARYRCDSCGFKARQFYWHCPACGGWETYPPRRSEESDLTA